MTAEPPVFEERRRTPDRRRRDRRVEDRTRFVRTGAVAVLAICGGLVVVFLFFAAIGAFRFRDAAVATVVTIVMATIWLAGYWYRHRSIGPGGPSPMDRERRGF